MPGVYRGGREEGQRGAQLHIRFDHGLEGSLALPVHELVYEVARHTGCVAVEPEEAVVVAQSPGCPQRQGMGHTGIRLQLPSQVGQLRGDVSRVLGEDIVEDAVGGELTHVAGQALRVQRLELRLALVELLMVTLAGGWGMEGEEEQSEAREGAQEEPRRNSSAYSPSPRRCGHASRKLPP